MRNLHSYFSSSGWNLLSSADPVGMQELTIRMINNLIKAEKQFTLLLYPDKTHSISDLVARTHLFTRIREFFHQELLSGAAQ